MFCNPSSTYGEKHQRSETYYSGHPKQVTAQCVETGNKPTVSQEETNLINLLDDFSISQQSDNKGPTKINDLQIKELEKFLSTTGTSNAQTPQIFTAIQDKELVSFLDKYQYDKKENIVINNAEKKKDAISLDFCVDRSIYIGTPKVLIPAINLRRNIPDRLDDNEDLIDEIILQKNLEKQNRRSPMSENNSEPNLGANKQCPSYMGTSYSAKQNDIDIMDQIISSNTINFTTSKADKDELASKIVFTKREIPKQYPKIEELDTKYNFKYLEAVTMEKNTFSKQSNLLSNDNKKLMTPGPTLQYKSVVLPQIMKRLAEKKQSLDDYQHLNKKIVLDSGSPLCKHFNDNIPNPLIFNHNAKSDPTENVHSRNIHDAPKIIKTNFCENYTTCSVTSKDNGDPEYFVSGSRKSQSPRDVHSRFISMSELKALRPTHAQIVQDPQPLMADCNKTRFVAYATSHLMKDFVGKKH